MKFPLLLALFLVGCVPQTGPVPNRRQAPGGPQEDTSRPPVSRCRISRAEAQVRATRYLHEHFGGCGGAPYAAETATDWKFSVIVGYAALHEGYLLVSKANGFVQYVPNRARVD